MIPFFALALALGGMVGAVVKMLAKFLEKV